MSGVNTDPHVAALLGALFERIRAEVTTEDLRPSHHRVLEAVPAAGARVGDLAARLGMTSQGCGQLVTRLVGTGHLAVGTATDDGRVRLVRRTPLGDAAVERLGLALDRVEDGWRARVGPERYAAFRAVLDDLAADVSPGRAPEGRSRRG
ncbi:hypothetical protein GCM10009737_10230 [Nocardioides lentus]|uniref:HTH marR-type domain-containing protein n=1 Tax=Nocardioides lentus TaxID=338077 RepID=A0ABN2P2K8_9ACTN